MLKKMRRTQFFDGFVCSDNLLIISVLCVNLPFYPQVPSKIRLLLSSCSDILLRLQIIHFLTFQLKQTSFFSASQYFQIFSALFFSSQRTVGEFLLRCK